MPYPRVIPHSDGSGTVDAVGDGVSREWIGRRVWCYGAQSYRAFGTAAEYVVVPSRQVVPLPEGVPLSKVPVLASPVSPLIARFTLADRLRERPSWCKAVRGRSEPVPFN
jgi:NADPH:quinone reductase-like Zn-dependent oxidoreductase